MGHAELVEAWWAGLYARVFDRLRLTNPLLAFRLQSSPDLNTRNGVCITDIVNSKYAKINIPITAVTFPKKHRLLS
jgi:hypothetical protein